MEYVVDINKPPIPPPCISKGDSSFLDFGLFPLKQKKANYEHKNGMNI